jgi:hypothetical protein
MAVVVAVGSSVQRCVSNPKEDLHQHLSLLVRQRVSSVRDVAFHHVSSELVFSPWKEGCRRCIIAMTLSVPCTLVFCRALVGHPVQVPPFGSWRDQEHRYRVLAKQTHVNEEYNPNNPHDTERFFQCDKVPSRIELVFDGKASLRKKG